ncbi:hypothetical protein KR200_011147 [Drosophila serrata]|nr:hypothetical protein KR200_011147 [Drosophila serrata]
MYTYLVVELAVTLTILLFVIYHAQTIHGNRFAEMRLNDFFLGSLILFHDFLIIFWLTFYWQIHHRFITPDSWIASSHSPDEKINQLGKNLETWPIETIFTEQTWDDGKADDYGEPEEPDRSPVSNEDQDEDSSQHRQITRKKDSGSRAYDRRNQRKHTTSTTPLDWSVFKGRTKASRFTDDPPAPQIRKPVEGFKSPGVLYKVSPVDGSKFPPPKDKVPETPKKDFRPPKRRYGSEFEYGIAKGKKKVGFGEPSVIFPVSDPPSNIDPARAEWDEMIDKPEQYPEEQENGTLAGRPNLDPAPSNVDPTTVIWIEPTDKPNKFGHYPEKQENSEEMHSENATAARKPNLMDDEMQGFKGTEKSQPDWELLSQEQLRNLSDSKKHRVKEKKRKNPHAEPLTTSIYVQTRVPDYEKLAMNDTFVDN